MEKLPTIPELMDQCRNGEISRREFVRNAGLLGLSLSGMATFLAGCGGDEEETTETTAGDGATTETTAAAATGEVVRGGTIIHASPPVQRLDPAFLTTVADDAAARNIHDFLVYIDESSTPDPDRSVAHSWESSEDGTQYTFFLRENVVFHDGKPMTSEDVKFTFDRLRDPEVGSGVVSLLERIESIDTPDDYTVVFNLSASHPDFVLDMTDYHMLIMDSNTTDFDTDFNATGPFKVDNFSPEDRLEMSSHTEYWMEGEDGEPLPYVAGQTFIFLADPAAQIDALRGGQAHYVNYLSPEYIQTLEDDDAVRVGRATSNLHYVLHMRSDRGPAADVKVRQALKAATDRSALLQTAALGFGTPCRDTPIGPAYGDFYLDVPEPARDVERAKQLLSEAGFADGLEITLTTQNTLKVPDMATVWKEQLAEAGVTVNIELVPVEVYYGSDNLWLEADFAITDWAPRPYPQPYLTLAYETDAVWNGSHWSDEELDELSQQAATEMDRTKRIDLYHQIQEIFFERGPIIVPYFADALMAYRNEVTPGIEATSAVDNLDVRSVWLQQ